MQRQGSVIPVVNPAIASTSIVMSNDELFKEAFKIVQRHNNIGATMLNETLHSRLKEELTDKINDISNSMIARFAVVLPYDEMQSLLMPEVLCNIMQIAGGKMDKQYTNYSYKLGEKVTIRLTCRGGENMPIILFPNQKLTMFSEDFLDLVRPLYLINKSWIDVKLAFEAICKVIKDTREFNFYVPWLRLVFPPDEDLANEFNAPFRVTRWLKLDREKNATIAMITKQVKQILDNEYTNRRTWMPSELVQMVRQGEELIAQYNIMKSVSAPNVYLTEDRVSVEVNINIADHPTIKWASEANSHRIMNDAVRLKALDEKKRKETRE